MRWTVKGNLLATLEVANEQAKNLWEIGCLNGKPVNMHLVYYGGSKYGIVDLNDYGRIIIRGNLTYLQGWIDGYLYVK